MGAQHTPGSWQYFDGLKLSVYGAGDINDSARLVARTDVIGRPHDEAAANARLIAAAPDLLVQLTGLLGLARFILDASDIDAEATTFVLRNNGKIFAEVPIAVLLKNGEAAIAKAEGR